MNVCVNPLIVPFPPHLPYTENILFTKMPRCPLQSIRSANVAHPLSKTFGTQQMPHSEEAIQEMSAICRTLTMPSTLKVIDQAVYGHPTHNTQSMHLC